MAVSNDSTLATFEMIREFKRKMPLPYSNVNLSPFDHQVMTSVSRAVPDDSIEMHAEVRSHIRDLIESVRDGKKQSQVILLSGDAGVGKTHLLRTFQSPELMEQLGFIFVSGSNHWTINEFQARLLDWIIEALTFPSPCEDHPLLHRIRAIGFRAIEHLLTNPVSWKTCLNRPGGKFFGDLIYRWSRPSHARLQKLTADRNPIVFRYFDFTRFSGYVCDRFLAERANPLHRYALRVMLTYLFPDRFETGVGTRERILHWFRGRAEEDYFHKRLGVNEKPDRAYSQLEAVKLLAHLFSSAVSTQLSTESSPCRPKVFLLAFDQAEGRDELFEDEADWLTFFAHLSELYNTLPNIVVLFTMTLNLRNALHGKMEKQFRDRIRMNELFSLKSPTPDQILQLYRNRIEKWLDSDEDLKSKYQQLDNPFIPFDQDILINSARNQPVRKILRSFDEMFKEKVGATSVDVHIDYIFEQNQNKFDESVTNEWDYTANHLESVRLIINAIRGNDATLKGLIVKDLDSSRVDNSTVSASYLV